MKKLELKERLEVIDGVNTDQLIESEEVNQNEQLPDDQIEPQEDQELPNEEIDQTPNTGITYGQMERLLGRFDLFLELLHEIKVGQNVNVDQ